MCGGGTWSLCPGTLHPGVSTLSRRLGRKHLAFSSSIWDSMGISQSCVEDESFLALPAELGLVLAAGGPVEEQQTLSIVRSELCKLSLLPHYRVQGVGTASAWKLSLTALHISNPTLSSVLCLCPSPGFTWLCTVALTWPSNSTPHFCHLLVPRVDSGTLELA